MPDTSAPGRPDPGRTALRDQLAAAERETYAIGAAFRMSAGEGHMAFASFDDLAGPVGTIARMFLTRADSPGFRWCKHLKRNAPAPAVWMPWHPDRLYCVPCSVALPPLSSKEDRRCDNCGVIRSRITPNQITAPAAELPQRPGMPPEARPAVTITFGLCNRCMAAAKDAQARSERERRRSFRLAPAGRPILAREAEALRVAVLIARMQGEYDDQARAAGHQEITERAIAGGTGLPHVLWGAVTLIRMMATTLLAAGDGPPAPRSVLWDEIGRDIRRLSQMSRDPRVRPDAVVSETLELDCRRAVALVRRSDAGDDEAFGSVPPGDVPHVLTGATFLLRSLIPTAVLLGLAYPEAEVWTGILASIDQWEAGEPPDVPLPGG